MLPHPDRLSQNDICAVALIEITINGFVMAETIDKKQESSGASDTAKAIHRFIQCLLLNLTLPLLPLVLEYVLTGTVVNESVTLVASMYAITIGVSSRYKTLLAFAIIVSILFTAAYGSLAKERSRVNSVSGTTLTQGANDPGGSSNPDEDFGTRMKRYSIGAIILIFLIHAGERYVRHVIDREPFWELT